METVGIYGKGSLSGLLTAEAHAADPMVLSLCVTEGLGGEKRLERDVRKAEGRPAQHPALPCFCKFA